MKILSSKDLEKLVRFFQKFEINLESECWEWTASLNRGYGQFSDNSRKRDNPFKAHRWLWEFINGPIKSPKKYLCHTCDNKKCVNPDHLYLGNAMRNAKDFKQRGVHHLHINPANNGKQKYQEHEIKNMRRLHRNGLSFGEIARVYKTDGSNVSKICRGLRYSWVNDYY